MDCIGQKSNQMINKVLRLLRIANDLSIKELSELSGLSSSYISELEKEGTPEKPSKKPSIETIDRYSKALKVDKSVIMFFEEEASREEYNNKQILFKILEKIAF